MVLVSFEGVHVWPGSGREMARMPVFGHAFFSHGSEIFKPIVLNFFIGAQENIVCR